MDTYSFEKPAHARETYEWDDIWFEQTDKDAPRIVTVGDSISRSLRHMLTAKSDWLFDNYATSKSADDPFFPAQLRLFAEQQKERRLVLFNNGLHGWHLSSPAYKDAVAALIDVLLEAFAPAPLALVLTTKVADPERLVAVMERNDALRALAAEKNLPVIDLFTPSLSAEQGKDGVHFTAVGCETLADAMIKSVARLLEENR